MGKKPEPPPIDLPARKVTSSKAPDAAAPVSEINVSEINGAQICTTPPEEVVRVGAYFRWDAAGRPGGDGVRFWLEAEQELTGGGVPAAEKCLQQS
jgi:hypothetical protein